MHNIFPAVFLATGVLLSFLRSFRYLRDTVHIIRVSNDHYWYETLTSLLHESTTESYIISTDNTLSIITFSPPQYVNLIKPPPHGTIPLDADERPVAIVTFKNPGCVETVLRSEYHYIDDRRLRVRQHTRCPHRVLAVISATPGAEGLPQVRLGALDLPVSPLNLWHRHQCNPISRLGERSSRRFWVDARLCVYCFVD